MKRILTTILLFSIATANAQSFDSLFIAKVARAISDSMVSNQVTLDSSQFAIVNKVIRMKTSPVTVNFDTSQFEKVNGVIRIKQILLRTGSEPPPPVVVDTPSQVGIFNYTDQFENSLWEKTNGATIQPNQIANVDGNMTADLFTAGTKQWSNLLRRGYIFDNKKYTMVVLLKRNNHDFVGIRFANAIKVAYSPFFNLSNGAINTQGIPGVDMTARALTDGWWEVKLTFISTAGSGYFDVAVVNSTGNTAAIPKGTEKFYIGSAQLYQDSVKTIIR